ncbi:S1 RNA-binding domain-containing protein [Nocardia noduli]|uniref:S1 RNA-binding domain-containing protein n=1 Tax=Nocardia noduli TaxID=2815722 RepID=UPI001C22988F|nr:S1 RNA-binding domain-containing protein [Nocardia noduli]
MDGIGRAETPKRGMSASRMRAFVCKDCQREVDGLHDQITARENRGASKAELGKLRAKLRTRLEKATYNENWALNLVERGGSRSDRCKEHRAEHRVNIQGLAVAYIDLETVGEVADRENPTGPLGGLGPLPTVHEEVEGTSCNLENIRVGMTDDHVVEMVTKLREKQILILKAGTGTGKSTFAPYRLMDPPPATLTNVRPGATFAKLTDLGPIIVTEPRVQAAVGVASFVGNVMSGAGGCGPGYPVGYQVSGDRNHDEACELIYVTDGTMINWLREGRLSRIGTVIVDEAHERSTNIDFIMGYLKRELPRYPHLRVIVTSATFNTDFYLEYFGGPANANVMDVPPEKTFGYGMPFFPNLDTPEDGEDDVLDRWNDPALPLTAQAQRNEVDFVRTHWTSQFAEPLMYPDDVADRSDDGFVEDVWETTRRISDLRFKGRIPVEDWQERMPSEMAKFVIKLARGLDDAGVFGDILGFLPTKRTIEAVCDEIESSLGRAYKDQVFPLISSLPKDRQRRALAKRRMGDPRKIVISTNLAETSLTVEGVRFVVDSGIIAQSEWDPELAKGRISTKPHSQAGIKQRWGRVGRKTPGWVFPLYTKAQLLDLAEDTPPGSTRDNLEALVMTAKMGGIDDVLGFDWPAAFQPATVELDEKAKQASGVFVRELHRADHSLRVGGAVDGAGHPTSFGKELVRFQGLGSTASALAIMYADRLACVPEVSTAIALLEDTRLIGQRGLLLDDFDWPDDWRLEAAERHRGLATLCEDEAELVMLITAAWEWSDKSQAPWEDSSTRQDWARQWWVNHSVLLEAAQKRQDVLAALSPAMKEEAKRFIEPALINRTRGVLTRAMAANIFLRQPENDYVAASTPPSVAAQLDITDPDSPTGDASNTPHTPTLASRTFVVEEDSLLKPQSKHVVALRRRESRLDNRISSLVIAQEWAMTKPDEEPPSSIVDAMQMLIAASKYAPADATKNEALHYIEAWPVGQRVQVELEINNGATTAKAISAPLTPFPKPKTRERQGSDSQRRRSSGPQPHRRPQQTEGDSGSREDITTEIRLDQRRGYDDEGSERAELLHADQDTGMSQACGQCFPCRDDRPEDCEQQRRPTEPGRREDLLAQWRQHATLGFDVSTPRVKVEETSIDSAGWYEVTGYARDDEGFLVTLRPDWRRGETRNAGQHPDLKAGDPVDVRVGQVFRHHGGSLRAFDRLDGEGRFILAEARSRYANEQVRWREIATSLDRGNTDLLEILTPDAVIKATVVPARAEGTLTITLLELLHQHWSKAQDGRGARNEILQQRGRNQRRERVYTAVVDTPANANGYVTARLLHQDSELGIIHKFDFNVKPRVEESSSGDGAAETEISNSESQLATGDPIMVKLQSDRASLDVSGLSIERLRSIAAQQAGQITINGLPDEEREKSRSNAKQSRRSSAQPVLSDADSMDADETENGESTEDGETAPPGSEVLAKTEKPLSRSAAMALVALSDEPDWPNEVWSFWARTHHLRVDDRTPAISGTHTEPFEVRATVHIEESTPAEQREAALAFFASAHPPQSVVECVVRSLSNSGVVVDLEGGIEGFIPLGELSWANRGRHPDQFVAPGDVLRAVVLEIPSPPARPRLSAKALIPDPFESFKRRYKLGARVTGTVNGSIDSAIFIDLGNDLDGSIHISELDHARLDSAANFAEIGSTIEVEVLGFDERARKVNLSRKRTLPHPYEEYKRHHELGETVTALVDRVSATHVNVKVGQIHGVVHVSNLRWERVDDATNVYAPGSELDARLIGFKDARRQLELSVKALVPEPYEVFKRQHRVGDAAEFTVARASKTHVNVRHASGAPGVLHVSQLEHSRVDDVPSKYRTGDSLRAKVLKFDDERRQVELSIKALLPEPYPAFKSITPIGSSIAADVTGFNDYFAYVRLPGGVDGSIHVAQISTARVGKPSDVLSKGQRLSAVVIGFDDQRKKVQLSLRQAPSATTRPTTSSPAPAVTTPRASTTPRATTPPITPQRATRPTPRSVVAEADTIAEAITKGCRQLMVATYAVTYEVLDPGEPKRFLRSGRPARVRVTTK